MLPFAASSTLPSVLQHWLIFGFRRLRHAHASHSLERKASIGLVQNTLGHDNVATTSRYIRANPDDSSALHLPIL